MTLTLCFINACKYLISRSFYISRSSERSLHSVQKPTRAQLEYVGCGCLLQVASPTLVFGAYFPVCIVVEKNGRGWWPRNGSRPVGTEALLSQLPTRSLLSPSQGWPSRVSESPLVIVLPPRRKGLPGPFKMLAESREICAWVWFLLLGRSSRNTRESSVPPSSPQVSPSSSSLLLPVCPSLCFFPLPFLVWSQVIHLQASIPVSLCTSVSVQVCVCLCLCGCLCVPITI